MGKIVIYRRDKKYFDSLGQLVAHDKTLVLAGCLCRLRVKTSTLAKTILRAYLLARKALGFITYLSSGPQNSLA